VVFSAESGPRFERKSQPIGDRYATYRFASFYCVWGVGLLLDDSVRHNEPDDFLTPYWIDNYDAVCG